MEENQESVTQSEVSSGSTEEKVTLTEGEQRYKNDLIRYKQKSKELEDRLAEIELKEEQKKGNYQGVIQKLKEEVANAKKENEQFKLQFATNTLDDAIRQEALAKGIKGQQLDVFMRLVDNNDKAIVEFDEQFKVKRDDVTNLVDNHLKRYSDIFKTKVNVVDGTPNNKPVNHTKKVDVSKMSAAEYKEYVLANKEKLGL